MSDCALCEIAGGRLPAKKLWEDDSFLCIENKYPKAPVHALVFPKQHIEKKDVCRGDVKGFHEKMMAAVYAVVKFLELDTRGYKLINNGAGYNHIEHEHWHILSGLKEKQE